MALTCHLQKAMPTLACTRAGSPSASSCNTPAVIAAKHTTLAFTRGARGQRRSFQVRCSAPNPMDEPLDGPRKDADAMRRQLESMVPSSAVTNDEVVVAEPEVVENAILELGLESEEDL